jgi:hypothetical protein
MARSGDGIYYRGKDLVARMIAAIYARKTTEQLWRRRPTRVSRRIPAARAR